MSPSLVKSVSEAIFSGAINGASGSILLGRIDSRIVIIRVIETWFEGVAVQLIGAELEPTSCHALEGAEIDNILDSALEFDAFAKIPWINQNILHTLTPVGTVDIKYHAESKMVTTGLLDRPEILSLVPANFLMALVYMLIQLPDKELVTEHINTPVSKMVIQALLPIFPTNWFDLVRAQSKKISHRNLDENLINTILSIYSIVLGITNPQARPVMSMGSLFDVYSSKLLSSTDRESQSWIQHASRRKLFASAISAFRYAVKYTWDHAVSGESARGNDEIFGIFADFQKTWHITIDSAAAVAADPTMPATSLEASIARGVENIFLLSCKKQVLSVKLLTIQNGKLKLGKLNSECVKGIWANVVTELLYITNDDDERYSIQAHRLILRNLMVQTAHPPFGYPIWVANAQMNRITVPMSYNRSAELSNTRAKIYPNDSRSGW